MRTVTSREAIDGFIAAYAGRSLCSRWAYSPNGGGGNAVGQHDWLTAEQVTDLLAQCEHYQTVWDGTSLMLSHTPQRGVHQYYALTPRRPYANCRPLLCSGSMYSRAWGSPCPDELPAYPLPEAHKTAELWDALWAAIADGRASALGLVAIDDPTDVGGVMYAVDDETALLAAIAAIAG